MECNMAPFSVLHHVILPELLRWEDKRRRDGYRDCPSNNPFLWGLTELFPIVAHKEALAPFAKHETVKVFSNFYRVELNQYSKGYRWDIRAFRIKKSGSGRIDIFVRMLQGAATMLCFECGNHSMH